MKSVRKAYVSRNPDVVRTRILDAAQAEFMAHGFDRASTNRIAERFGGSKPTMFRHFETKRSMFDAVVGRIASSWTNSVDLSQLEHSDPANWLRAYSRQALAWILSAENLFVGRVAIAEGQALPEVVETYRRNAVEPLETMLASQLRKWTVAGQLTSPNPARDAESYLDLAISGVVSRRLYHIAPVSDAALERHIDHVVDLFLYGLVRSPPA